MSKFSERLNNVKDQVNEMLTGELPQIHGHVVERTDDERLLVTCIKCSKSKVFSAMSLEFINDTLSLCNDLC